jgi:crotonobetainyl-CoA:carnitine CoA-transferase CaiB-like acyl-CoA transferase
MSGVTRARRRTVQKMLMRQGHQLAMRACNRFSGRAKVASTIRRMPNPPAPLAGLRVVEVSMLGPGNLTTHLADLGADVIKVEPPQGDYGRRMTWPIVDGVSLLFLHISRGKRSIVLDLRTDAGREAFLELVRDADAVVEAMRPGGLERRGLGFEELEKVNPKIVFATISGYGMTGPYRDMPSHGIAYDVWAGIVEPKVNDDGFTYMPEHVSIGINAGPVFGALGLLAGVLRARETGRGCQMEIAQSDAAAAIDWLRSETWRAYERPESEVTGNEADNFERRAPGTAGMEEGVRYQFYESADGHILFMASEREFWKNFCEGIGQPELFEKWPGSQYGDHARGNTELRVILREVFKTKTTKQWLDFGLEHNTPIAPSNSPKTLLDDPQFEDRMPLLPASRVGADMLPTPIKFVGEELPMPTKAPTVGQHTEEVLRATLGWTDEQIAKAREAGAFG